MNVLPELRIEDLQRLVALSGRLATARTFDEVVATTVGGLRTLVDGDFAVHNVIDSSSGRALMVTDPPEAVYGNPDASEQLTAFGHQHPQIRHWMATDAPCTTTISDFMDPATFHGLDLYQGVFRPVGIEDVLTGALTTRQDGVMVAVSVMRSRRSFTLRDRGVMEACLPLLRAAVARVRQRAALEVIAAGPVGRPIVVVGVEGTVVGVSPRGQRLLNRRLGTACPPGSVLPSRMRRALRAVMDNRASSMGLDGGLSVARAYHRPEDGLLILELASGVPDHGDLMGLGLTPRQAEILALIAGGATNFQIASALAISPNTVRTHNERIYTALGVDNRTSAAALALAASG